MPYLALASDSADAISQAAWRYSTAIPPRRVTLFHLRRPGAPLYHQFPCDKYEVPIASVTRAISAIARVNSVSLQCEVVAYRLAACAEVARDYRRLSRVALEES